jgi:transposase
MEGLAEGTALVILSESGTAMRRWPSGKHLCSGLGLAPHHKSSGGSVLSRHVRPGAPRVTVARRLAARTVHQAHTALGAFSRRMRSR